MLKKIYVIRHCEAVGQPAESQLTENGLNQAKRLADFLSDREIDQIISSPYLRAIQTAEPLSKNKNIKIEIDERLSERILSKTDLPDWYEKLKATFDDLELKFEGGESSQEAMSRIVTVVEEAFVSGNENTAIVSHGNIISLLLKNYDSNIGFEYWRNISNPDVFQISCMNSGMNIQRIWIEEKIIGV